MSDATTPSSTTPRLREKGRLMSSSEIERTLVRLAHEIVERNNGSANLGLIGIKRRGVPLAQRIAKLVETIEKSPVDTGVLDISFYRDDLSTAGPRPIVEKAEIGFDVNGRDIILMDDVLYTGRTIRRRASSTTAFLVFAPLAFMACFINLSSISILVRILSPMCKNLTINVYRKPQPLHLE